MSRALASTGCCGQRCSALTAPLSLSPDGSVMWRRATSVSDVASVYCRDASSVGNLPQTLFGKKDAAKPRI